MFNDTKFLNDDKYYVRTGSKYKVLGDARRPNIRRFDTLILQSYTLSAPYHGRNLLKVQPSFFAYTIVPVAHLTLSMVRNSNIDNIGTHLFFSMYPFSPLTASPPKRIPYT